METLERRRHLAGQVTVSVVGDTLVVRGDEGESAVTIGSAIRGTSSTYLLADNLIVNDQPYVGRYFFKQLKLDIDLGGGNDMLTIPADTLGGNFHDSVIRMGDGNDRLEWSRGRVFDSLFVNLGTGDDRFSANGASVPGAFTLLGGTGRDRVGLTDSNYIEALNLVDRSGPTQVDIANGWLGGLVVSTGHSVDRVSLTSAYVQGDIAVATRGGDDIVALSDYQQPSFAKHAVNAGDGSNRVIDVQRQRPKATGRLDATLTGTTLDLVGTGGLRLNLSPQYGPMEETVGTAIGTDANLYVNGVRKPTRAAMFNDGTPITLVRIRLDDTAQTVTVDYDALDRLTGKLDIATGGGDDVIHIDYGPTTIGVDAGKGDDRVFIGSAYANATVNLGPGRDRFGGQYQHRSFTIIDPSGPATIDLTDAVFDDGGLTIRTSDSIDRVTLNDVKTKSLTIATAGGRDVLTEEDLLAYTRSVDLGEQ